MTRAEQARLVAWRLKILQHAASEHHHVAQTCRYFGISCTAFYRWKKRFDEHGDAGLADRPKTPHHFPRATCPAVVSKILYLRQNYHFGAYRIAAYLLRFHQIEIARSSVHRILVKNGMGRLPANQKHRPHRKRWKRYENAQPGQRLPFRIPVLQTDNGAEFQSRFHWHAESLDVRHVYIRPASPHLNGKVERSHGIDEQEFYQVLDQGGVSDNIQLFYEKLRKWEDYHNYHRPHGAVQDRTPYERLIEKSRAVVSPGS